MARPENDTPLWDNSDNSPPDTGAAGRRWDRSRAEDAARAYAAIEEEERRGYRGPPYRGSGYRREYPEEARGDDFRRRDEGRRAEWPRYEAAGGRGRHDDMHGYDRHTDRDWLERAWPSEFGYPPARDYSPYGGYPRSARPDQDPDERGFLERAGDELRSWFGDREAQRRRAVDHRGRGPKSYVRSDARIAEDVNDRLTEDVWIDASAIEVSVAEGEVTLAGTVEDRRAKRRAEDVAEDVAGVKHVQNNLRYNAGVVSPAIE
jgi:hypothetical protein